MKTILFLIPGWPGLLFNIHFLNLSYNVVFSYPSFATCPSLKVAKSIVMHVYISSTIRAKKCALCKTNESLIPKFLCFNSNCTGWSLTAFLKGMQWKYYNFIKSFEFPRKCTYKLWQKSPCVRCLLFMFTVFCKTRLNRRCVDRAGAGPPISKKGMFFLCPWLYECQFLTKKRACFRSGKACPR